MKLAILAWFGLPGGMEWVAILVVALLIFGRRLPDVARSVGKSIVEFKKGLKDVKTEIDVQGKLEPPSQQTLDQKPASTVSSPSAQEPGEPEANAKPSSTASEAPSESGSAPSG
jgi:sec-independent protein translocase protein TatA